MNRNKLIGYAILTLVVLISIGFAFAKTNKTTNVCIEQQDKGFKFTNPTKEPFTLSEILEVQAQSNKKSKSKECFDVLKESRTKDDKDKKSTIQSISKSK